MREWINVKDEMPEFHGCYLVTGKDIELELVYFCPDFGWRDEYEITHWMELPEPPKTDTL